MNKLERFRQLVLENPGNFVEANRKLADEFGSGFRKKKYLEIARETTQTAKKADFEKYIPKKFKKAPGEKEFVIMSIEIHNVENVVAAFEEMLKFFMRQTKKEIIKYIEGLWDTIEQESKEERKGKRYGRVIYELTVEGEVINNLILLEMENPLAITKVYPKTREKEQLAFIAASADFVSRANFFNQLKIFESITKKAYF